MSALRRIPAVVCSVFGPQPGRRAVLPRTPPCPSCAPALKPFFWSHDLFTFLKRSEDPKGLLMGGNLKRIFLLIHFKKITVINHLYVSRTFLIKNKYIFGNDRTLSAVHLGKSLPCLALWFADLFHSGVLMSASVCCNLLAGLKYIRKPHLTQICSWKGENLEEPPESVSAPQGSVDHTLRTADLLCSLRFYLSSSFFSKLQKTPAQT